MNEDIKILEEFMKRVYEEYTPLKTYNPEAKAIENLIARNKELLKALDIVNREKGDILQDLQTDFIPKSKVKEIKEACEKVIETAQGEELSIFEAKLDVCEELIED